MVEEVAEQLSFPDLDRVEKAHHKVKSHETKKGTIPVNAGASLFTGPLSSPYHQFMMHVPDGATCRVRNSREEDGDISLSVEFESPPEIAGKVGWLSRIKGSTKFK